MTRYYIGLMSGTSADGIDVALVDFSVGKPRLIDSHYQAYDHLTREQITSLYVSGNNEVERMGRLDTALAKQFANAVNTLLVQADIDADEIVAIGNHGQTIRHRPSLVNQVEANPFTLQIGCSQTLACLTGIPVIGQFRLKDIALGGQGAPLVPPFHQFLLKSTPAANNHNIIVNIGGIANLTNLPSDSQSVQGYDTGPGNCLLDDWYQLHHPEGQFDKNGDWAETGSCDYNLLNKLLSTEYFKQAAPKSTGREVFNLAWLNSHLESQTYKAEDVQATLLHLTVHTIADQIKQLTVNSNQAYKVWLCGGGRLNPILQRALATELGTEIGTELSTKLGAEIGTASVAAIEELGIDGDQLEAMAFAWLAFAYTNQLPSNMPAVTGAQKATSLGALFSP